MSSQVGSSLPVVVFTSISMPALGLFLVTRWLLEINTVQRVITASFRRPAHARVEDGVYGPALAAMAFAIVVSSAACVIRMKVADPAWVASLDLLAATGLLAILFGLRWVQLTRAVADLPTPRKPSERLYVGVIKAGFNERGEELLYCGLISGLFMVVLTLGER